MKSIKCLLLITFLIWQITIRAQENNVTSLCGQIENEQLSIPAYKFAVTDKNGKRIGNLQTKGILHIDEYVWTGTGILIFDTIGDAYWKRVSHDIAIPVVYDSSEGVYISQEIPKVKLSHRRTHRFSRKRDCWDKVSLLSFDFSDGSLNEASYYFHFPNTTIDKLLLPDAKNIINLELKEKDK